jgi:hypothetical protein
MKCTSSVLVPGLASPDHFLGGERLFSASFCILGCGDRVF